MGEQSGKRFLQKRIRRNAANNINSGTFSLISFPNTTTSTCNPKGFIRGGVLAVCSHGINACKGPHRELWWPCHVWPRSDTGLDPTGSWDHPLLLPLWFFPFLNSMQSWVYEKENDKTKRPTDPIKRTHKCVISIIFSHYMLLYVIIHRLFRSPQLQSCSPKVESHWQSHLCTITI